MRDSKLSSSHTNNIDRALLFLHIPIAILQGYILSKSLHESTPYSIRNPFNNEQASNSFLDFTVWEISSDRRTGVFLPVARPPTFAPAKSKQQHKFATIYREQVRPV